MMRDHQEAQMTTERTLIAQVEEEIEVETGLAAPTAREIGTETGGIREGTMIHAGPTTGTGKGTETGIRTETGTGITGRETIMMIETEIGITSEGDPHPGKGSITVIRHDHPLRPRRTARPPLPPEEISHQPLIVSQLAPQLDPFPPQPRLELTRQRLVQFRVWQPQMGPSRRRRRRSNA
ncbi:hypothetical protein T439DRAFT_58970 [Meredithblackwellia eburnea MCA 4105]